MKTRGRFMRVTVAAMAATVASFLAAGMANAHGQRLVIEIKNFEFVMQEEIELHKGDVVIWINRNIAPHTATAEDGSWDSGLLKTGASWEMVVTEDMVFSYYCRFHPSMTSALNLTSGAAAY